MSRYARQTCLPEIGPKGQAAFAAAHVLVIGAGGLAAPVLPYLAGAGIGRITLVDADRVSLSNLHRQVLFGEGDLDRLKVDVAAERIRALNSECAVETVSSPLDPLNAPSLIGEASIVLDCADSFAASYILSDSCFAGGVPLISASVLGLSGYVGGFCASAPSLRAVFPDLPEQAASCATAGVLGPVVGMIGAAQAQMALAVIAGLSPSPLGQVLRFDMGSYRMSGFRFDGAPEPARDFTFIAPAQIKPADFVIELRGQREAAIPVAPQARRESVAEFKAATDAPNPDQRAVFACRSGLRAWQAATHLRSYWDGPISLIAMGDPTEDKMTSERQKL